MKIGVLALQGAFAEHMGMLESIGVESGEIRCRDDFNGMDGFVIPGGESTTIRKLMWELDLMEPIAEAVKHGMPVFGTCAGMILLAQEIEGSEPPCIGAMDVTARRNAYGRQLGSFTAQGEFHGVGAFPMVFIRAPYITRAGADVEVLAKVDGKIVAVRQRHMLATAFHPELTGDTRIHAFFAGIVGASSKN